VKEFSSRGWKQPRCPLELSPPPKFEIESWVELCLHNLIWLQFVTMKCLICFLQAFEEHSVLRVSSWEVCSESRNAPKHDNNYVYSLLHPSNVTHTDYRNLIIITYLYHIILYIIPYHIIYHLISYLIIYHIISHHIIYHIIYRTISYIISYRIVSYRIISYRIIPYHISYRVVSYYIILYYIILLLYYILFYLFYYYGACVGDWRGLIECIHNYCHVLGQVVPGFPGG